ncbi:glucose 1-dehydrogenase [Rothia aerolata]|uniref:Gluconate 5-dehydrogenase n=1 Tax=Rothia aerolata TaxID=1812262 RepID=A0A917IYZ7_9MICC|nr:glucose 1-dehydrogenase [Rothia aerolata]GGH65974.1 gluconate 5-dehydrogenase [Rothia aerolata]
MSNFDLTGQTALVTGSSRGIGKALATALAQAGAKVAVHGRTVETVEKTATEIAEATGAETFAITFDVTSESEVSEGVKKLTDHWGTPDILVNNAGMQKRAKFSEFPLEDWQQLLEVNLTSAFLVSRAVAPGMEERGSGKIINIGSVQSQLARPSITPYSATKGGIVMLTKGLCADLSPLGIQVNAIAPGYFATELTQALVNDEEFSAWVASRTPAGRWGKVEDLGGAVVFLASEASDFITGQTLYVDGGMTSVI